MNTKDQLTVEEKLSILSSLIGVVPNGEDVDLDKVREERLARQTR